MIFAYNILHIARMIVKYPNCGEQIIIERLLAEEQSSGDKRRDAEGRSPDASQINCGIFRHGIIKKTGKQINPHLEKSKCDLLFKNGKIYGCGKPFRIRGNEAVVCDYI